MNCKRPLRPRPGGPLGRLAPSSRVASGAARRATCGSTHFACGHAPGAGRTARRRVLARTPSFVTGTGFVGRLSHVLNPDVHGAPYVRQTPCQDLLTRVTMSRASVASRLERGDCSLSTSPLIRTHALSKARARAGASCWRSRLRSNPSERQSLRQAEQVAVRASEPAVRGAQGQRRSARKGTDAAPRKSGAAARGMAPTPWRCCHGAGRLGSPSDQAQSFAEISTQVTTPEILRPRYCSASS